MTQWKAVLLALVAATPAAAQELTISCRCVSGGVNAQTADWIKQSVIPGFEAANEGVTVTLNEFAGGDEQLTQQLAEAGLPAFDSGTVYRTLRQLEKTGMVSSFWDTSDSGPARRMYSLTKAGDIFLSGWIDVLGKYQAVLQQTLEGLNPDRTDEQPEPPRALHG